LAQHVSLSKDSATGSRPHGIQVDSADCSTAERVDGRFLGWVSASEFPEDAQVTLEGNHGAVTVSSDEERVLRPVLSLPGLVESCSVKLIFVASWELVVGCPHEELNLGIGSVAFVTP
jgi:hypothetical protein